METLVPRLEEALRAHRCADIGAGSTTVGPHRDDFEVLQDDRPIRAFASQGQQRAAALALRLGLAALAEGLTKERPLLLLDDVLSELDVGYRGGVLEACRSAEQAILTSTDLEDVPEEARRNVTRREVRGGQII